MTLIRVLLICSSIFFCATSWAQSGQEIRGRVIDRASNPVSYASVVVVGSQPLKGVKADSLGRYSIRLTPGRYDLRFSSVGYAPFVRHEVLVTSGKAIAMDVVLDQTVQQDIVVESGSDIGAITSVNVAEISVEQASRFAGGFDDPARLATALAGVSAQAVGSNGIVVRGNSPSSLLWQLEGIEIPNPSHFADLQAFGSGGLTALSSQVMDRAKLYTGALPARFPNALAGVFDLSMRKGNPDNYEHTLQAGIIGLDAASEGPLFFSGGSSYLFNYRYSTLTLLEPLLPPEAAGTKYQDLSFKLYAPLGDRSTLSVWGIGLVDNTGQRLVRDTSAWTYDSHREEAHITQWMSASGIEYRQIFGDATNLTSTLAFVGSGLELEGFRATPDLVLHREHTISSYRRDLVFQSTLVSQLSRRLIVNGGVRATRLSYDLAIEQADSVNAIATLADGSSPMLSAFASVEWRAAEDLTITPGVTIQYFELSGRASFEPRLGISWQAGPDHSLAFGYSMQSRLDRLPYYFVRQGGPLVNRQLDFSKSHTLSAEYRWAIDADLALTVSPYYQSLYSIPVIPGNAFSAINMGNDWFFSQRLVNDGKGRNLGLDVTLQQYLHAGLYFLVSHSLFRSSYLGGDARWRPTRYDRGSVTNLVAGYEWSMGSTGNNMLSISLRGTVQGGERIMSLDEALSKAAGTVVLDSANAWRQKLPAQFLAHGSISYRMNWEASSLTVALNVLNLTGQREFKGYRRNTRTGQFEQEFEVLSIPNLSIKWEF